MLSADEDETVDIFPFFAFDFEYMSLNSSLSNSSSSSALLVFYKNNSSLIMINYIVNYINTLVLNILSTLSCNEVDFLADPTLSISPSPLAREDWDKSLKDIPLSLRFLDIDDDSLD